MKALEEKIISDGSVCPGNVLKVGSFLNHQIDVDFLMEIGKEISHLYKNSKVTKVITVEASGIGIAVAAAAHMHVPVVFAKKHQTLNISSDVYSASVYSYTHCTDYNIVISKDFISSDDNVLIVDDFLAHGNAVNGLIDIAKQAGATVAGVSAVIEKGFQHGGDNLRESGIRVESLAVIDSMEDGKIVFRH